MKVCSFKEYALRRQTSAGQPARGASTESVDAGRGRFLSGVLARSRRRLLRLLPAFGLAAAAVALTGCSVGRANGPQVGLFDLGPSTPAMATLPKREPISVNVTAVAMLNDTGVIWRIGESANPQSYATYRWAATPAQLLQQRLVERLSAQGPVLADTVDPRAPVLQVTLTRFEQVYAPDGSSSEGRVGLQAVLLKDRRTIDAVRVARAAPATTQDAAGGVQALRVATDAALDDLALWLSQKLPAPAGPMGVPLATH
ncbi:ABC-type transport auxiliary lipoprotein family protein [Achromobacter aloeverae]